MSASTRATIDEVGVALRVLAGLDLAAELVDVGERLGLAG